MVCHHVPTALLDLRLDSPQISVLSGDCLFSWQVEDTEVYSCSPLGTPQGSCLQDALLLSLWSVLGPQSHEQWPFP